MRTGICCARLIGGLGMQVTDESIVKDAYAAWVAADLVTFAALLHRDVGFAVRMPVEARTYVGEGHGREQFVERLAAFLEAFDVLDFCVLHVTTRDDYVDCRIRYHYRGKLTRLEADGSMRQLWRVLDGKIVHFEVFHDAQKLGAFFDLADPAPACT